MSVALKRLIASVGTVALYVGIAVSAPHAAFPGTNGLIAFVFGPDIYTMNPDGSDIRQLTNMGDNNCAVGGPRPRGPKGTRGSDAPAWTDTGTRMILRV
jgi:hypothetical protein